MTDEQRIATYYDRLVDAHGDDPRAVDASSAESLRVRYEALAAVGDLSGRSVLEVGCGLGGLGSYLTQRFADLDYRGIDISHRMIDVGRRSHPRLDLRHGNVLQIDDSEAWDFVLAQGIFYLLGDDAEAKMFEIVTKMFALATTAVAFTAISSWSPAANESEFYADPARTLELCRNLSTSIVLRHDYHPGDMAVYLYKREPS